MTNSSETNPIAAREGLVNVFWLFHIAEKVIAKFHNITTATTRLATNYEYILYMCATMFFQEIIILFVD